MKIYVAGHLGLVGSAVIRAIEAEPEHTWIGKTRKELDLLDRPAVFEYVKKEKPDWVVIAAAKVGGIQANSNFPVEFLSENLQIQTNLIDACHAADIERVLFLGSSCIYPKLAPQPIKEEHLMTGPLEPSNEPYAIAKIAGLKLIEAYNREYGRNWISVMPTNLYGPGDNFDLQNSHVIPALIRKFHEAKVSNLNMLQMWGTGNPKREFLHSDDLASACLFLLKNYQGNLAINIGSGEELTIKKLSQLIADVVGFHGRLTWGDEALDGTPRKLLNLENLGLVGWKSSISLHQGIASTYKWYLDNLADL